MKKLILTLTMLTAMTAQANVVCKKEGRYWYPENATAKKIAKALKVKTCSGKRFRAVVAQAGLKSNAPLTVKKMTVKELAASLRKGN